jgi:hypothetical protein
MNPDDFRKLESMIDLTTEDVVPYKMIHEIAEPISNLCVLGKLTDKGTGLEFTEEVVSHLITTGLISGFDTIDEAMRCVELIRKKIMLVDKQLNKG